MQNIRPRSAAPTLLSFAVSMTCMYNSSAVGIVVDTEPLLLSSIYTFECRRYLRRTRVCVDPSSIPTPTSVLRTRAQRDGDYG